MNPTRAQARVEGQVAEVQQAQARAGSSRRRGTSIGILERQSGHVQRLVVDLLDASRVVLLNVLSNAVRYTPPEGDIRVVVDRIDRS